MTDIWVFNESPQKPDTLRWDALLQLHKPEVYTSPNNFVNKGHWDWLQQEHGKPIYMQAVDPRVPDSVAYPLEGVLAMIPYRYIRSSIAAALALAIYLDCYEEIGLYGINLVSNTEYGYQAMNMAFWIGFAHGREVNLVLHCWLDEFNQRLYAFEGEAQIDRGYFARRVAELETAKTTNDRMYERGLSEMEQAMLMNDCSKVSELSVQLEKLALVVGETDGVLGEARRYGAREDPIPRQEFERTSAWAQVEGDKVRVCMFHEGGKCEYVWNVWKQTGSNQALQQLRLFTKTYLRHAHETGFHLGVHRENLMYMQELDSRITAAGGVRTLAALGMVQHESVVMKNG